MNYNLRIEIQKQDTGIVYQDENTMIVWLPVKPSQEYQGGYWESDGDWATAVLIFRTVHMDWNSVSFNAKGWQALQDSIDDWFFEMGNDEQDIPSLSNR